MINGGGIDKLFDNSLKVIAEIGVNHEGSVESAVKMIRLASKAGANFIKLQSYTPSRYASRDNMERFKRVSDFSLSELQFNQLFKMAKKENISLISTPLSEDWVDKLKPYCSFLKIASGDITFKEVIVKAARTLKPIIISTGGSTVHEIDQAVKWVENEVGSENLGKRLILMHCVSAYPTPIDEANILSIPFLRDRYEITVGYSNHVIGKEACYAAVAQGANIIEIHFTDNKYKREFRDHELSFDQNDLLSFINTAEKIKESLGRYEKKPQPCEKDNILLIRKGLVASRDVLKGQILMRSDIKYARTSVEYRSDQIEEVIGRRVKIDIKAGFLIKRDQIECVE